MPGRLVSLFVGLTLFGAGEACVVAAGLGVSPWTVLAQGVSRQVGWSIGLATVVLSGVVLLLWIPLRQRPGIGTVANAVWVGTALDLTLLVLPDGGPAVQRTALLLGGIALVAAGSGFYLGAALGAGPRDGLMQGLHAKTGRSLRLVRTSIEASVLVAGALLGGTVGVGTVAFALLIGPAVQLAMSVSRQTDRRSEPVTTGTV